MEFQNLEIKTKKFLRHSGDYVEKISEVFSLNSGIAAEYGVLEHALAMPFNALDYSKTDHY